MSVQLCLFLGIFFTLLSLYLRLINYELHGVADKMIVMNNLNRRRSICSFPVADRLRKDKNTRCNSHMILHIGIAYSKATW